MFRSTQLRNKSGYDKRCGESERQSNGNARTKLGTGRRFKLKYTLEVCLFVYLFWLSSLWVTDHEHNDREGNKNQLELEQFLSRLQDDRVTLENNDDEDDTPIQSFMEDNKRKKEKINAQYNAMPVLLNAEEGNKQKKEKINSQYNAMPVLLDDDNEVLVFDIHHGRVVKELSRRILSRSIAQSDVLVVSSDIPSTAELNSGDDLQEQVPYYQGHGLAVVSHAIQQGHTTSLVPASMDLNQWWTTRSPERSKWFLMSYFVGDFQDPNSSIDAIFHPSKVGKVLKESTLTYMVIAVHSQQNLKAAGTPEINMDGLTAVQTLLDSKYKVQLLAASHFNGFHPNDLFKNTTQLDLFLSMGAKEAESERFDALLFATQGLDLAIPSRLSYLTVESLHACKKLNVTGRCDSKLFQRGIGQEIFLSCPHYHNDILIAFDQSSPIDHVITRLDGEAFDYRNENDKVEMWFGHEDVSSSEAACMKTKNMDPTKVACASRIIPKYPKVASSTKEETNNLQYNFLSILIDPISRYQFERSLPTTSAVLKMLGFTSFSKYTAVGDNSGPNQAALFTGHPLLGGRDGIKSSDSHGDNNNEGPRWLWDAFNLKNYVTLKAENGCIENSNMVQSMKPNTTHGDQLYEMFCFDFDRPNCLGKHLTAQYLTDYATQFIDAYENPNSVNTKSQPWAAFLSFIDSHEDTVTLISYIDTLLADFIQSIDLRNTIVIVSSDHGLHYGPSFASNGERERAEPMLQIHMPAPLKADDVFENNKEMFVTPFDVHETILDATSLQQENNDSIGTSLLQHLPASRQNCDETPAIPDQFCALFRMKDRLMEKKRDEDGQCSLMEEPPSMLSFYADIPRSKRPSWPKCKKESTIQGQANCLCNIKNKLTNEKSWLNYTYWQPCSNLFGRETDINHISMKTCPASNLKEPTMEVNIKLNRNETLVRDHIEKKSRMLDGSHELEDMPNILFIEIDSLSHSAALRHMPKTMAKLYKHRMIDSEEEGVHCPSGFCAAMFNKTSVIGQSSIPNQLAALSGCSDIKRADLQSYKRKPIQSNSPTTKCPRSDLENPWLFDIVEKLGYVTFLGEEFCYKGSPYVIQDNHFVVNPHYNLNEIFCPLSDALANQQGNTDDPLVFVEHGTSKDPNPCVDGRSRQEFAFEYIRNIWNAYPDTPKFAYLNSLSGHDYSLDRAYQPLGAEDYDDYLSEFLEEMLRRPDAQNTFIVLRSDHGLQGGPSPIDFSFQVEHMNPFNNLIVPSGYSGLSLDALFVNQNKLVTGYDLYSTLRAVIAPRTKDIGPLREMDRGGQKQSGIPEFAFNLLDSKVPKYRTCSSAKIQNKFCPCIENRIDLMPHFYIGHSKEQKEFLWPSSKFKYNPNNAMLITEYVPGKSRANKRNENLSSQYSGSIPNSKQVDKAFQKGIFQPLWHEIDTITASYNGSKISGGIFLYPRQTILIANLILELVKLKELLKELPKQRPKKRPKKGMKTRGRSYSEKVVTVCETGFGAGHSAALFLSLSPNVNVITFDKFDRPYQIPIALKLKKKFPNRFRIVQGDSCETLPEYLNLKCDFLHGSSLCATDNIDLVKKSQCNTILTSTAMNSLTDGAVYFGGKKAQWQQLVEDDCIDNIACFKEEAQTLDKAYVFATKDDIISHEFCFARVNGRCNNSGSTSADMICNGSDSAFLTLQNITQMYSTFSIDPPSVKKKVSNYHDIDRTAIPTDHTIFKQNNLVDDDVSVDDVSVDDVSVKSDFAAAFDDDINIAK